MSTTASVLLTLLCVNALVAFAIVFFWQLKVMLTFLKRADLEVVFKPWKAHPKMYEFGRRFYAGEIYPDLRDKWLRSIKYVVISFVMLIAFASLTQFLSDSFG